MNEQVRIKHKVSVDSNKIYIHCLCIQPENFSMRLEGNIWCQSPKNNPAYFKEIYRSGLVLLPLHFFRLSYMFKGVYIEICCLCIKMRVALIHV